VTERLPELLDAKALRAELGVTRAVAEKVMRKLPVVEFPGIRKVYVRRDHLADYLERCTSPGEWRFVKGPAARGEVSPAPSTGPARGVV
jgi:hypothetical protein